MKYRMNGNYLEWWDEDNIYLSQWRPVLCQRAIGTRDEEGKNQFCYAGCSAFELSVFTFEKNQGEHIDFVYERGVHLSCGSGRTINLEEKI
ncbi:MAG: hypothetical protein PHR28_11235 [candidate division Zixibacteria bacterium]|nr:hypothetical protein [candidate division Zixibacteria bacterium]